MQPLILESDMAYLANKNPEYAESARVVLDLQKAARAMVSACVDCRQTFNTQEAADAMVELMNVVERMGQ